MDSWQRKHDLLSCLQQSEGFVSGEDLAHRLGVTRAAISKHVKQLSEQGLDIYSVKGKGYRLAKPISLINSQVLQQSLERQLFWFHQLDSTNRYIMDNANRLQKGDTCIAETQSAGRGRRGRNWVSPYGCHLYQSVYWRLDDGFSAAMGLSLVVGLSLAESLTELGIDGIGLKWPNDIYRDSKKLAGVLVELKGSPDGPCHLIIGFGINVSMPTLAAKDIDQPWSDLCQNGELEVDKNALVEKLHAKLLVDLAEFELSGLTTFLERWHAFDEFRGREVLLTSSQNAVGGLYQGIDKEGNLKLLIDGFIKTYAGGEVSLRLFT
ncbi:bifunctional biotin--[acetyl-CoA-carboxylase] ligase/biotin operon repressor BirA [Paraferrimonas haliotis]|uniref:bifunctional biotin--[acetyl-CoA-carboxylase] ligase/biotin operon repressor BirA n=1 Tax=Paraferrimonas haliotis TaxID=2013866 RepID=UPI000BA8E98E|nr:bifunctional biotin--[acetyl-CoA-carboxylase] ligase/biotin operon repressor BirA [Paraferrimonas haliotis]